MNNITVWLAVLLIIGLMIAKWRLGLYSILDEVKAWITKKKKSARACEPSSENSYPRAKWNKKVQIRICFLMKSKIVTRPLKRSSILANFLSVFLSSR